MIRALLLSSRPLSWINTAYPFAAAFLLSEAHLGDPLAVVRLVVGTLFFLVPYNFALYGINDVFDYESDLRNPRKGGVEGALLDRRLHRTTIVGSIALCAPFVVALIALGSWPSWIVLAISLFALVAYSAPGMRFKERPGLDSFTSATHFVSPAIYGIALAGASVTPGLVLVLAAFYLWGIASHAFGAVQDVEADRAGGIGSIATVVGARATVRIAFAAYLAASVLLLASGPLGGGWPGALAAILPLPYALNVIPWLNVTDAESATANRAWRRFLWLNFLVGFLTTLLLIAYAVTR